MMGLSLPSPSPRRQRWVGKLALLLLVLMAAGCGSSPSSAPLTAPPPGRHPLTPDQHLRTVFLIVMENQNWWAIYHDPAARYLNSLISGSKDIQTSYATQYYNPPHLHPSLPNYLWLEAGTNCFPDTGCVRDDGSPASHASHTHHHLVDLLQRAGISWRAYEENISGRTCPLTQNAVLAVAAENGAHNFSRYLYAAKHDPFVYFDDVTGNRNPRSSGCIDHIRPFTELALDLRAKRLAQYNFITPNLCDDMHSACPAFSNAVKQGDRWLSRVIPTIQRSRAYRDGGVIFITWDEGVGSDGPIGMIVLSPDARGRGYHNAIRYTHSSMLRTIEEIFHVRPLLGGAAHANDLRGLFRHFP